MNTGWWAGRSRRQRLWIAGVAIVAGVALVVLGYNLGLTNETYVVSWFLRLYPFITEVWGALAFILACVKAYVLRERPEKNSGGTKEEDPLEGPLGGAISEGLVVLSQFAIASLLLALLGEGRLGPVTNFDEYGIGALTLFLYYSSGKGMGRLIRFVDTHVIGPANIPAEAKEKGKGAVQVEQTDAKPPNPVAPSPSRSVANGGKPPAGT